MGYFLSKVTFPSLFGENSRPHTHKMKKPVFHPFVMYCNKTMKYVNMIFTPTNLKDDADDGDDDDVGQ